MTRITSALSLIAIAALSLPAIAATKGDPAKGQALAGACAACHGIDGNSVVSVNPNLAGQHAEYIAKQLAEFKAGTRANAIMAGMAAGLTPEAMADLGAYFRSQKVRAPGAKNRDLVAQGRKLYRGGDAARGLPACSACHSPTGAGMASQYPRIGGQHADYTVAQLKAFRAGERANDGAAMMRTVAAKLTDAEMSALAEYLSGLR
jgi:cytochrome c553